MLDVLCGNKNVQKILIFMFVNGKCYGTQVHKHLKSSLTPIQKALLRLEKGGIILSYYEGKTRVFKFNPGYPLLTELEGLLKKAFTLLSAADKKEFYVVKQDHACYDHNKTQTLLLFWNKLAQVKELQFNAKTKEDTGWNGKGKGEVSSVINGTHIIFHEKGTWNGKQKEVGFSNVFRWTLDRTQGIISLEHLRRGHPVFLFNLIPSGKNSLTSMDSHLCAGDTYFGQIHFDKHSFHLNWRVIGPKKNEEIDYYYY